MKEESNYFMGIDVSKDTLDIYYNEKHFKIKNENKSISNFIKLERLDSAKIKLCVLESTGGYEKLVMKLLQQASVPVHRAHPNRVHSFAKTIRHFAKTDKLDSMLLAKYARFVADEQSGDAMVTAVYEQLQSLKAIEFDLETHVQANKSRLHHLDKKSAAYVKKQIAFAEKQLQSIRADIDRLIDEDDDLKHKRDILESYKGVGRKTAGVLLVSLPELGTITNNQIASLVGVAPKTHESGKKINKAHISGGRFFVRRALYMPALVAARYNNHIRTFYDRLIANGKPPKIALVVVMRKIIICLNSMIKNNSFFA